MPEPIEVRKIPLHNVSDAGELAGLIDNGVLDADRIVAVIGKTEGNGGVNDYPRIIADRAFREVIGARGTRTPEQLPQIPIVWFGGTAGSSTWVRTARRSLRDGRTERSAGGVSPPPGASTS